MHIESWRASRSGARMTVSGYMDGNQLVKLPVVSIQGPSPGRLTFPAETIGVRPDGEIVVLA
jgi:hypothetical protein